MAADEWCNPASVMVSTVSGKNDLAVGIVTKGHGLKGEVKIRTYVIDPEVLVVGLMLRATYPDGRVQTLELRSIRTQGGKILVGFTGIDDRTQAEGLRGVELAVKREDLPPLGVGEYYLGDLVGYTVVADSGEVIGPVQEAWAMPANDVLQVVQDGREVLIPVVDDIVKRIDHLNRQVLITVIEGLLE